MENLQTSLAGLKVIELARFLAGPWINETLADLDVEVMTRDSEAAVRARCRRRRR